MDLPINNRIRAEYVIPQEILENPHVKEEGLVEQMNRQLMTIIASELLKSKPEIVERATIRHYDPYGLDYHKMRAEVFVFTSDELMDLIRKVQIETSTQIREQMTLVDNWKNK